MSIIRTEEEEKALRRWEIFWRPFWIAVIIFAIVLLVAHHYQLDI